MCQNFQYTDAAPLCVCWLKCLKNKNLLIIYCNLKVAEQANEARGLFVVGFEVAGERVAVTAGFRDGARFIETRGAAVEPLFAVS
jgi:hypothetical protein